MMQKSLDEITKSGWYCGYGFPELNSVIGSGVWCHIFANVQSDNAASFIIGTSNKQVEIYRDDKGIYSPPFEAAQKSDLNNMIETGTKSITVENNGYLNLMLKNFRAIWLYREKSLFSVFYNDGWWYANVIDTDTKNYIPNGTSIEIMYVGFK